MTRRAARLRAGRSRRRLVRRGRGARPRSTARWRAAAEARRIFVNAVDDLAHATAYLGGVLRRGGVTSRSRPTARAPALAGLLREGARGRCCPDELDDLGGGGRAALRERAAGGGRADGRAAAAAARGAQPALRRARRRVVSGFVSLVGAGPGDPELLTRKRRARARPRPTSCSTTRSSRRRRSSSRRARSASRSASARAGRRCARRRSTA